MDSHQKLTNGRENPHTVVVRPRLKWSRALHDQFTDAVARLGGAEKATPKSVMRVMGVPGLTLYHLKSHLQKYRLAKSRKCEACPQDIDTTNRGCKGQTYKANWDLGGLEISVGGKQTDISESMLEMQMTVQKQLLEQIEVQKHLQLRIEAQGKYLRSVLKKAQETLAAYDLEPAIQNSKNILASEHRRDHSNNSCITTWEKSDKNSQDNSSVKSDYEETSLPGSDYLNEDNAERAQGQVLSQACEELLDLNR